MGRFGGWGYCDRCHRDTWVVAWERDYMDEPETFICGGECGEYDENGVYQPDGPDDDDYDGVGERILPPGSGRTDG